MRNVLSTVPKGAQEMVASIIRTVFAQPDAGHVHTHFNQVARMLGKSHPKVAAMLDDAREDVLAFAEFPTKHWRQVWSTNPMERVNKEIKRRTDVVGVFPNPAALLRLARAVLRRVIRVVQDQRDARYNLLRGYFHGADDDNADEIDHERLNTFTLTAGARAIGQPLARLALAGLNVRVASLRRRDGKAADAHDDTVLADGDTLVLSGKPGALAVAIDKLQKG